MCLFANVVVVFSIVCFMNLSTCVHANDAFKCCDNLLCTYLSMCLFVYVVAIFSEHMSKPMMLL
jgi:hypothetical protein